MFAVPSLCLVIVTASIALLGYRATREWERSALGAEVRRAHEARALLSAALLYDMKGAQTVLSSVNEPMLTLDPPSDLADQIANTFARFPYPESFFAWKDVPENGVTYLFSRPDRPPPWVNSEAKDDSYPVVVSRDAPEVRQLVELARAQASGRPFAIVETKIEGVEYQVVLHFLYDATPPRLSGLVGFVVNVAWIRDHYFGDLISQILRINGGEDTIGIEIRDDAMQVVASAGPSAANGPVLARSFPLVFADRTLLSSLPRTHRSTREWIARISVARDPSLLTPGQGATRMLWSLAIAAVVTIGALVLIVAANREAAVLAAMKADFVSSVTHELKTPLAFIQLASDTLAKRRYSSPETLEEYASMLATTAKQLTRLVDNVLNYSRLNDAKQAYAFEPVDVQELIEESLDRMRPQLSEAEFDVQVLVPADVPRIRADRTMIELALSNLLDNALKYGQRGRSLAVASKVRDGRVIIEVTDRGDGIESRELSRVFDKFYRGRGVQTGGTGLGLAIVRKIVQDHGGRVAIRSVVGSGTTVELSFPAL